LVLISLYSPFACFPDLEPLVFLFAPFSLVFLLLVDLHAGFESGISVSPPTLAMSDEESSSASSSSLSLKRRRPSPGESTASDPMETDSGSQQESGNPQESGGNLESGSFSQASGSQEASSSGQASSSSSQSSGEEPSPPTRGAWMGSNVTEFEIDWLYRSRRIPEGVSCRIPDDECRCLIDGTSEEGSSRGGEEVGAIGRSAHGTVVRDLPSFGTPAR
jgi:hypothetical protein